MAWKKRDVPASEAGGAGESEKLCQDIALAVLDCKETATSRESFIRLMNERGYRWTGRTATNTSHIPT